MSKPTISMKRVGHRLEVMDQWSAEQLESFPQGVELNVTATRSRSHRQNGFYWVGLGIAVGNFDDELKGKYPTAQKLHKAFLVALGFTETVWTFDGEPVITADSTAFDNMSVEAFNLYFTSAQDKAERWLGWNPWDGVRRKRAA